MKGLDKYLTTQPEDKFSPFCEQVIEIVSLEFYTKNEDWLLNSEICNAFLRLYFDEGVEPKKAAIDLEKFFNHIENKAIS